LTTLAHADAALLLLVNHALANRAFDHLMPFLSRIGTGGAVWIALAAVAFALGGRRGRRLAVTAVFALLVAAVASDLVLKGLVQRPRPFDATQLGAAVRLLGPPPSSFSFPSGHTSASFAVAPVLARAGRPSAVLAWLLAAGIAFSRIYVGAHFPGDVLGGVVVGLASARLAIWALGEAPPRSPRPRFVRRRPRRRA
jgi:undecaprenyl-diphosphatase